MGCNVPAVVPRSPLIISEHGYAACRSPQHRSMVIWHVIERSQRASRSNGDACALRRRNHFALDERCKPLLLRARQRVQENDNIDALSATEPRKLHRLASAEKGGV